MPFQGIRQGDRIEAHAFKAQTSFPGLGNVDGIYLSTDLTVTDAAGLTYTINDEARYTSPPLNTQIELASVLAAFPHILDGTRATDLTSQAHAAFHRPPRVEDYATPLPAGTPPLMLPQITSAISADGRPSVGESLAYAQNARTRYYSIDPATNAWVTSLGYEPNVHGTFISHQVADEFLGLQAQLASPILRVNPDTKVAVAIHVHGFTTGTLRYKDRACGVSGGMVNTQGTSARFRTVNGHAYTHTQFTTRF